MEDSNDKFWADCADIMQGKIPEGFIYALVCKHCGVVPSDFVLKGDQDGCMWCGVGNREQLKEWKDKHETR